MEIAAREDMNWSGGFIRYDRKWWCTVNYPYYQPPGRGKYGKHMMISSQRGECFTSQQLKWTIHTMTIRQYLKWKPVNQAWKMNANIWILQLNIKTCILFTTMMPFCLIWKTEPSEILMNDVSAVYTMIHSTMWYMPIQSTVQICSQQKIMATHAHPFPSLWKMRRKNINHGILWLFLT